VRLFRWFEKRWFFPEGFRPYSGSVVVWDSHTREDRILLPGSHWWHRFDEYRIKWEDPGVILGFVECEGDVCVWWYRLSECKRWAVAPPMEAYPWGLKEFSLDMRPTPEHPKDWAKPTIWDRLSNV